MKALRDTDWMNVCKIVLLVSCLLGIIFYIQTFFNFRKEYHERSDAARKDRAVMKKNDSIIQFKLDVLIKGQINTHEIQTKTLTVLDSSKPK